MPISCEMTNTHRRHVHVARDWENFKNNEGKGAERKENNPGKDTVSVVKAKIIMKY